MWRTLSRSRFRSFCGPACHCFRVFSNCCLSFCNWVVIKCAKYRWWSIISTGVIFRRLPTNFSYKQKRKLALQVNCQFSSISFKLIEVKSPNAGKTQSKWRLIALTNLWSQKQIETNGRHKNYVMCFQNKSNKFSIFSDNSLRHKII